MENVYTWKYLQHKWMPLQSTSPPFSNDQLVADYLFWFCLATWRSKSQKGHVTGKTQAGPILDIEDMDALLGAHFFEKGHFVCSHPLNRCHI